MVNTVVASMAAAEQSIPEGDAEDRLLLHWKERMPVRPVGYTIRVPLMTAVSLILPTTVENRWNLSAVPDR